MNKDNTPESQKEDQSEQVSNLYTSLSPVDIDEKSEYLNALTWAVDNKEKEDIFNLAITGPYGSGKSSILKTFKKLKEKNNKFLSISLATFKEEPDPNQSGEGNTNSQERIRQIEVNILQQIFYAEKDKNVPNSRFKKIKTEQPSKKTKKLLTLASLLFILSIVYKFSPISFWNFIEIDPKNTFHLPTRIFFNLVFWLGTVYCLYQAIHIMSTTPLKKASLGNVSIELDTTANKSIFNQNLDEILYYFEITKTNIVIIEDLDRFKQTEIFTKLREINLLINNSKKVKQHVLFIYAVRDDKFSSDGERTKFFDFIIPVIPVINFSNSASMLMDKLKKGDKLIDDLSEELIDDLALFVSDMRLLNNITNEYFIYKSQLDFAHRNNFSKEDSDAIPSDYNKLLALIIYKNIEPKDFADLAINKGKLYGTFQKKSEVVKELSSELRSQIKETEDIIEGIDKEYLKNEQELRWTVITNIFSNNGIQNLQHIQVKGQNTIFSDLVSDTKFDDFLKNGFIRVNSNHYGWVNCNISESERTEYKERSEKLVNRSSNKIQDLRQTIKELQKEDSQLRHTPLSELISKRSVELATNLDLQNTQDQLISILLRSGYIDEDYHFYISMFYSGSLMPNDYEFLRRVKMQQSSDYSFQLTKIEKLLKKVSVADFGKDYILNISITDQILSNLSKYKNQGELLLTQLSNETVTSVEFINEYIEIGTHQGTLFKELSKKWNGIFDYYSNNKKYDSETYFDLIIKNADIQSIKQFSNQKDLKQNLELSTFYEKLDIEKAKGIISELQLKLHTVYEETPQELVDFIYENNHYRIIYPVIKLLLRKYSTVNFSDEEYQEENYSTILKSSADKLIQYVEGNFEQYVQTILIHRKPLKEKEENFLKLLNDERLSETHKSVLIEKQQDEISDISEIEDYENVAPMLFSKSKVKPSWDNLFTDYQKSKEDINDYIITFLNARSNSERLAKRDIPIDEENSKLYLMLIEELINCEEIILTPYYKIMESLPYSWDSVIFEGLSEEKVHALVVAEKLELSAAIFDELEENYDASLKILLLERNESNINDKISELTFTKDDILNVINSPSLNDTNKALIIKDIDVIIYENDVNIVELVLPSKFLSITKKLDLLENSISKISSDCYKQFILSLDEKYHPLLTSENKFNINSIDDDTMRLLTILKVNDIIKGYTPHKTLVNVYPKKKTSKIFFGAT